MPRLNLTFRLKILLSIVVTVTIFLGILLVVVRDQTSHQIGKMAKQAKERSNEAFEELVHLYHAELQRFAGRISYLSRIPAALQEAVEEDEPGILIDAANYELKMAQIPLAVFTDETGQPFVTLLEGKLLENEGQTREHFEALLREKTGKPYEAGYQVFDGRLFITHGLVLTFFGRTIGTVTIGFPMDNALAERMGKVIQAKVGFVVAGRLYAATPLEEVPGLKERMTATGEEQPVRVSLDGSQWILIGEPLNKGTSGDGRRVIAVSLDEYLAPLYRIETVFRAAGVLMLAIALALGISISRGLAAPVRKLVEGTRRVARGEYDFHVNIKGKDELYTLAESFNRMTDDLLLKEQYRGILDKVVSPEIAQEMVKGNIALGGENREVTTLFADIRGFASMTEGMEPQEVIAMLNQFMEHAAAAVEAEGGVVDKYVGDQIMALFGAPVSHPDDPLRAVRAALRMNENINRLNKKRQIQNEPEIKIGVGINTGIAVAGNMGSVKRLNYTVLGNSVNVASRLCSQAGPSEILVSGHTHHRVAAHVETQSLDPVPMKGLSNPVKVFRVKSILHSPLSPLAGLLVFILIFLGIPGNAHAWASDTDYLSGFHYMSESGKWQVDVSGRLQLTAYVPGESPSYLIYETDPFVSGRLSVFTDMFMGSRLYGLVELRADRGEIPSDGPLKARIQQAYFRYTFLRSRNLHLQVGKIVSPFGEYSQRHDTAADPFIRPPLNHEYRTMICPGLAPRFNDGFIRWKFDPDRFRPIGAPVVWGVPYQAGVMLFGSFGKFNFRLAAMNSAPSSAPEQWDPDFNQGWNYSLVAHVGWRFSPEFSLGVSVNYGPYSLESITGMLPAGTSINDFNQEMIALNAVYTLGKIAVRAEWIYDYWEVPNVKGDPVDISYYLEVKYKFLPGFFGAFRYNAIHFNKIAYDNGEKEQWDYNVQRWELGMGYAFSRRLEVRAQYLSNRTAGPLDPKDDLLAVQWIWRF